MITEIYRAFGGFHVDKDLEIGTTLLIARTTAAFGRSVAVTPQP
jgi:hypothetical protein